MWRGRDRARRSKAIAVADADAVDAFDGVDSAGVRHVLEVGRQAVVLVEAVADLDGAMEQHARAERLVPILQFELAVVDGAADAKADEQAVVEFVLPVGVETDVAGLALGC